MDVGGGAYFREDDCEDDVENVPPVRGRVPLTSRERVLEALTQRIDQASVAARARHELSGVHWLRMCELYTAVLQQWFEPLISSSAGMANG